MPPKFEIAQTSREVAGKPVKVLNLIGQLDAHTFSTLQGELEQICKAPRPQVVLDCTKLDYIGSAALAVLSKMTRDFRLKQGDLRLAKLGPKIENVVELLGFSRILRVFKETDKAVASFGEA
jgi:anti-anti-sigma factor